MLGHNLHIRRVFLLYVVSYDGSLIEDAIAFDKLGKDVEKNPLKFDTYPGTKSKISKLSLILKKPYKLGFFDKLLMVFPLHMILKNRTITKCLATN